MSDYGSLLRKTRENKALSFAEVESVIKISSKYLQALEDGNITLLPGKAYAIGFLKSYAKFLGLDYVPLLTELKGMYRVNDNELINISSIPIRINNNKTSNFKNISFVVIAVILITVGISFYKTPTSSRTSKQVILQNDKEKQSKSEPNSVTPTSPVKNIKNIQTALPPLKILVRGGKSWVMITLDGKIAFKGILYSGQTKTYTGKIIALKVGNAGVVDITYNNSHIGYLGKLNQVIQKSFGK